MRLNETLQSRTLADILPAIGAAAATLVECLRVVDVLQDARLTCKGLRDFIDANVGELTLTLSPDNWARWVTGQLPSLERWPRCSHINVNLQPHEDDEDEDPGLGFALATLPFLGLSPEVRQRITKLRLIVQEPGAHYCERDVSHLAVLLPNLQELDLAHADGMSYAPQAQQLMYDSLATLQQLRTLELRSCRALSRIGTLAANSQLTSLAVSEPYSYGEPTGTALDRQAVAAIAKLRHLRTLYLGLHSWSAVCEDGTLSLLLNSLPPALERLRIQTTMSGGVSVSLLNGCVQELALSSVGQLDTPADLLRALVGCGALGMRLPRLSIFALWWSQGEQRLDSPEYSSFWELLRRSDCVEISYLHVCSVEDAPLALRRLGAAQHIHLVLMPKLWMLQLRLQAAAGLSAAGPAPPLPSVRPVTAASGSGHGSGNHPAQPTAASASVSALTPAPVLAQLPSAKGLGRALLYRLSTGAPAGADVPPDWELASAAASGPRASPAGPLLLSGSLIAGLAQAPDLLKAWVRWLGERAAAAAAADGGDGAQPARHITDFRLLPAAMDCPGLLIECADARCAAAVAAAAEAVAVTLGAPAALVVSAPAWQPDPVAPSACPILSSLQQELQALWDRCVGQCGGVAEAELELMQAVMRLWLEFVAGVPASVLLL